MESKIILFDDLMLPVVRRLLLGVVLVKAISGERNASRQRLIKPGGLRRKRKREARSQTKDTKTYLIWLMGRFKVRQN